MNSFANIAIHTKNLIFFRVVFIENFKINFIRISFSEMLFPSSIDMIYAKKRKFHLTTAFTMWRLATISLKKFHSDFFISFSGINFHSSLSYETSPFKPSFSYWRISLVIANLFHTFFSISIIPFPSFLQFCFWCFHILSRWLRDVSSNYNSCKYSKYDSENYPQNYFPFSSFRLEKLCKSLVLDKMFQVLSRDNLSP